MKTYPWQNLFSLLLITLAACGSPAESAVEEQAATLTSAELADTLRYFRRNAQQTDILSRNIPDLSREQAFDIQLDMLKSELANGASLVGWKMGGTATADTAAFDPVFGYILDRYLIDPADSVLNSDHFPGGSILVEGEIGFVLKNDLSDGVASIEDLMNHIDYVVGAVELAQSTAVPIGDTTLNLNYVLAAGMGQVGTMEGNVKAEVRGFDFDKELVKCYVDGALAAEGVASNIFGSPLNALFELANLLPEHDLYLKEGDLVITGSVYKNPSIKGAAKVHLEFTTLGSIDFSSK